MQLGLATMRVASPRSAGADPDGIAKPPSEVRLVRETAGQRDLRERLPIYAMVRLACQVAKPPDWQYCLLCGNRFDEPILSCAYGAQTTSTGTRSWRSTARTGISSTGPGPQAAA
jgi:hypothetical protein